MRVGLEVLYLSYIEKARALGEALAKTPEVQALISAEAAIMADSVARPLFMEFREKEKSVVTSQMLSGYAPEKDAIALVELKGKLSAKNPLIKNFFQATQKHQRIMAMVNLMITTAINGTPKAEDLPIPEEMKGLASQLLDPKKAAELMQSGKLPEGFKLPPGMKLPGGKQP
jgi:cell fate (sporulation/competence/biofilm development) regulator YlbF (YheA/YmcA/DUF963 family)